MYTDEIHCPTCKKVTQHENGKCVVCEAKLEARRIAKWNRLSVDKRLDDIRRRIEELERGGRCDC